jgi:hypothetical protein
MQEPRMITYIAVFQEIFWLSKSNKEKLFWWEWHGRLLGNDFDFQELHYPQQLR